MWTIIGSSLVLAVAGVILLRLAGRKSIAQMAPPQITILLMIGTVLGSEVGGKGVRYSLAAVAVFVVFLTGLEWLTVHWNRAETLLKGKAVTVIQEGRLLTRNLEILRISVDDLEKRLRMAGLSRIEDIKNGTIEDNGELGYELFPHARPLTLADMEKLLEQRFPMSRRQGEEPAQKNLFTEITTGYPPGEKAPEPLQ
ncbi:DUF421 domain-containing protein [Paenibacillus aurantius]|uniref:DUF421 domain-containing protein n=1 Tax=Paenibacillus aurantius TaxID=2918900 RepID=A0AA96LBB1_9BACL|nr:YetF domain-containing protein [Paenibacillus aurantius]WNQ10477.1 DUF421 domain-containing protein [Paenibacillus aurantius]